MSVCQSVSLWTRYLKGKVLECHHFVPIYLSSQDWDVVKISDLDDHRFESWPSPFSEMYKKKIFLFFLFLCRFWILKKINLYLLNKFVFFSFIDAFIIYSFAVAERHGSKVRKWVPRNQKISKKTRKKSKKNQKKSKKNSKKI